MMLKLAPYIMQICPKQKQKNAYSAPLQQIGANKVI
jgi:hypothetical protein